MFSARRKSAQIIGQEQGSAGKSEHPCAGFDFGGRKLA